MINQGLLPQRTQPPCRPWMTIGSCKAKSKGDMSRPRRKQNPLCPQKKTRTKEGSRPAQPAQRSHKAQTPTLTADEDDAFCSLASLMFPCTSTGGRKKTDVGQDLSSEGMASMTVLLNEIQTPCTHCKPCKQQQGTFRELYQSAAEFHQPELPASSSHADFVRAIDTD